MGLLTRVHLSAYSLFGYCTRFPGERAHCDPVTADAQTVADSLLPLDVTGEGGHDDGSKRITESSPRRPSTHRS